MTHDGMLIDCLMEICRGESRTQVKSYLSNGRIMINDRNVTAFDHSLKKGDILVILDRGTRLKKHSGDTETRVRIIYEDEHLIVAEKRHAVLTMSTGKEGEATAYSILMEHVKRQARRASSGRRKQDARVFIVHRLDRDTSGLMVYAKDIDTEQAFEHNWHDIVYDRRYVAVVSGEIVEEGGTVANWLKDSKAYVTYSSPVDNGGKYAVTHYHVLARTTDHSLVEFKLETGRKNQIRVHSADMGHPVCGDVKYGNGDDPLHRLCLHAYMLCFVHPVTRERMEFETPIPATFRRLFK